MKKIKQFFMPLLLMLFISMGISPQLSAQGIITFNASGTFTVPPGVTTVTYKIWAAGGGAGLTPSPDASGGGGGGAFVQVTRTNLVPGQTYSVVVGTGGVPGSDGGASSVDGSTAQGGKAGVGSGATTGFGGRGGSSTTAPFNVVASGANFSAGSSQQGGDGGAATSPDALGGGEGGGGALFGSDGSPGANGGTSPNTIGGSGGSTSGGNGGNQGANGMNGGAIGGGGGGRGQGTTTTGGSGANGLVEISYTCPTLTSISYTLPVVCSYSTALSPTYAPTTATGGTFSSSTLGAFLNTATGIIATGAPQGTHVITYGWVAANGCPARSVTFTLTIAPQAVATGFSYAGSPACTNLTSLSPTFTTLSGVAGVYSSASGLSINSSTGVINPAASTPGNYTVTYTVAANGNCNIVTATTNVTITLLPVITSFDYPGDNTYCAGEGLQPASSTLTNPNGNGVTYSYTTSPGLSLNTTTGEINPALSDPGVYIVTLTIAAGGGCAAVTATSTVEILARPTATIAYTGNPFCQTVTSTQQAVTITGVTGGPLTAPNFTATPAGLTINATTGSINLNSTPGIYTVKYRFVGANGCLDSTSTSVTIKSRPTSTLTTADLTVCSNVSPTIGGNVVATGAWTLTLSNGQTATGTGNGPWSIVVNDLDPGEINNYTVTSLIDANNCPAAGVDRLGNVVIVKRTITSGSIPTASNVKICEGIDASINVTLTSPANNCAPNPQFSGVFKIEKWNGAAWIFQNNYPWTITVGPSITSIPAAIAIPASNFPNATSNTLLYRVSWVSLVDCNGCTATPLTGNVVVEAVPTADITISAAPTADVCPGTNITFNVAQTTTIPLAVFGWVATDVAGNVLGSGSNVNFGTNAVNTNLGLSCPYNGLVTFTFNSLNPTCCNCSGAPITRTVMVRDIVAPTWTTVAGSLNVTLQCSDLSGLDTAQAAFPVATDNCDNNVANIVKSAGAFVAGSCPQAGTYTNTWTVTDDCNNVSAVFTQVITIIDTQAPTWTTAAGALNRTLQCSDAAGLTAAQALFPTAVDNCDLSVTNIVKSSGTFVAGSCPQAGTYTNTWTVRDDCTNLSAVFTQVITIIDTQAPTWTTAPAALNVTLQCSDAAGLTAAQALFPTAIDNCDLSVTNIVKSSGTFIAGSCPQAGTYTNTWTVRDDCTNLSAVFTQVITIIDTQAPTWTTAPAALNVTLQCSDAAGLTAAQGLFPTAIDNCDLSVTNIVKSSGAFVASTICTQAGTYTNTWTVRDDCTNLSAIFTQVITIIDTQAPTWTTAVASLNRTIQCNDAPALAAAQGQFPAATDNCDASVINIVKVTGAFVANANCPQSGTRTNTWTVRDDCGNISVLFTQVITIIDNTAPVLITAGTLPANQLNINGCIASAPIPPTAAAIAALYSDNCGTVVVNRTGAPAGNNCSWTAVYTYTIADNCGNALPNFVLTFTGSDRTAPVFAGTVPTQTLNVGAFANCMTTIIDYRGLVSVTDCGTFTLAQLAPNTIGTSVSGWGGYRDIVIQATDECSNTSTTTFRVELKDLTAPNAICRPFTLVLNAAGTGVITTANINNGSNDNCAGTTLTYSLDKTNFNCSNVGANTVTLSVTDQCLNTSTCTAIVTVVDNTAPVVVCFGDTTVNKDANCTYTMPNMNFRLTATDACGIASVTQSIPVGHVFAASQTSTVVTLTARDVNGNATSCSFTVNFVDVTPPVIVGCPANITVFTGLGNAACSQTATWTPPTATDACTPCCQPGTPQQTITGNFAPGATFPRGITTVTYTATDLSGNTSICTFTVTVVDNTKPLIANCPANISVNTGVGRTTCDQTATWTEPTATDNCTAAASLIRFRSHAPGATFPVGITMVKYAFTDAFGNTSDTCRFNVLVSDNTIPVFVTCPSNIANPPINTAGCLANLNTVRPTFSDNCAVTSLTWTLTGATTASSPSTGINYVDNRTFGFGITTVTYTARDAVGNTAVNCSFTVTVTRPLSASISGTSSVLQNLATTSTVGFTAQGGTAPYTFVYTTTNGFGAPGNTITTVTGPGGNASTIASNPNHLITTVPQSNATPGVYTYTLVSVTDFYGCVVTPNTTATVTVVAFNHPSPDLTSVVSRPSATSFNPNQVREGYIDLSNVVANPTTGVVTLRVSKPTNFALNMSDLTVTSASSAVQNANFSIVAGPGGLFYTVTSLPGYVIGANSSVRLGFSLSSTGTNSTTGLLTILLADGTGGVVNVVGDNNLGNNTTIKVFSNN